MAAANMHFPLLCLLAIMLPACAQEPRSSTTLAPDSLAREWLDAWNSHDIDRILTYYTEDAFYEDVPTVENGWAAPVRGHQMIRESLVETFEEMSDLGLEFVSASSAGDRMMVEWIMTGTHYRDFTGRFSIRAVSVIKLEGDRIASVSDYYDAYLLLSQLGMVPALDAEQPETSRGSATLPDHGRTAPELRLDPDVSRRRRSARVSQLVPVVSAHRSGTDGRRPTARRRTVTHEERGQE